MDDTVAQDRAQVAFVGYSLVLAFVLLSPSPAVPSGGVTVVADVGAWLGAPEWLVERHRAEFVLNVAALAPLSFLGVLAWSGLGWREWTAYGFVLALSVEAVQAVALAGRSATFVDVVANTAGATIGALVVSGWRRLGPGGRPPH